MLKPSPRLEVTAGQEKITYIPDADENAGALCVRLLEHLKGVQLGKVADQFGWCVAVTEADGAKATRGSAGNSNGANGHPTVDQLD